MNSTTYKNPNTGSTLEVMEKGKRFVTRRHYPASKHSAAEVVEKVHANYSAVEKIISKGGFVK